VERLGQQDGVAPMAVADELVKLAAVTPGCLVQVMSRQEDRIETAGAEG
jgi:hypothetical protein